MKTVGVFKDDCGKNDDEEEQHVDLAPPRRGGRLSVFQDDLKNDVARVTTTVDHFFEQIVKVAQIDDVFRVVVPLIKIPQLLQLQVVRFAFDVLQFRIHLARGADVHSFTQLLHHRQDSLRGLVEKLNLFGET